MFSFLKIMNKKNIKYCIKATQYFFFQRELVGAKQWSPFLLSTILPITSRHKKSAKFNVPKAQTLLSMICPHWAK